MVHAVEGIRERHGTGQRTHALRALRDPLPIHPARIPLARQLACPVCAPHEHHLLPCDAPGCVCLDPPIPGTTW